jgi:hypothetical protein
MQVERLPDFNELETVTVQQLTHHLASQSAALQDL